MHKKYSTPILVITLPLLLILLNFMQVHADPQFTEVTCADGFVVTVEKDDPILDAEDFIEACGSHGYNDPTTPPTESEIEESSDVSSGSDDLDKWINIIINTLSAIVGVVITVSLIFAGIQYMTARDNSSQVAAAKNRIVMTILAFVLFLMGYAFLQWLVPGGIW